MKPVSKYSTEDHYYPTECSTAFDATLMESCHTADDDAWAQRAYYDAERGVCVLYWFVAVVRELPYRPQARSLRLDERQRLSQRGRLSKSVRTWRGCSWTKHH